VLWQYHRVLKSVTRLIVYGTYMYYTLTLRYCIHR